MLATGPFLIVFSAALRCAAARCRHIERDFHSSYLLNMNKLKVSPSNKENRSTTPLGTDRLSALHSTSQYLPKNKSKEVSLLQSQLNALEKQHERLKQAHQHSMSEYAKLSQENTALRKEAEVQRQALSR